MEFARKNTKTIAITAGITASVALGLYFILKRRSSLRHKRAHKQQVGIRKPLTEAQKRDICSQAKLTYNGKYLSPQSVVALCEAMQKVSAIDQANLVLENRKLRRANLKNPAKYVKLCEDFYTAHLTIIFQSQNDVLKYSGISDTIWNESYNLYFDQQNPILMQYENEAKTSNYKDLCPENVISIAELKAIFKRSPQLAQEETLLISNWAKYLTNPEAINGLMTSKVNDRIFEEFGVEEEEVMKAVETQGQALFAQGEF